MVLKAVASVLAPAGSRARLSILIFHRVLPAIDPLFPEDVDERRFDATLGWLRRWFRVLPLDEAVSRLSERSLPSRAAAITFDDGYADNATIALPLLQRHGMTATFFVATGFLDGGCMWNDSIIESVRRFDGDSLDLRDRDLGHYRVESNGARRRAIDELLVRIKHLGSTERADAVAYVAQQARLTRPPTQMMTTAQVRDLRKAGMQVGAHTRSHPILARLPNDEAQREIVDSKIHLEALLDESVTLFAYPNGKPGNDYLAVHARMARQAGFTAAVSTAPGVSTAESDKYQLPRYTPWGTDSTRFGVRLVANLRNTQPHLA